MPQNAGVGIHLLLHKGDIQNARVIRVQGLNGRRYQMYFESIRKVVHFSVVSFVLSDTKEGMSSVRQNHEFLFLTVSPCISLDPAWNNLKTETTFPVDSGTELTVSCEAGFLQSGSDIISCTEDTTFSSVTTPSCVGSGEHLIHF